MTETLAGFGEVLDGLPPRVRRAMVVDDATEAAAAKRAQAARETAAADRRDRVLGAAREQAIERGEQVSAMAMISGDGLGRTIHDVLTDTAALADRQDAITAARRRARGEREEDVEIFYVHEPVLGTARPLSRRELYVKRLTDAFVRRNPGADVISRQQFRAAATKAWKS